MCKTTAAAALLRAADSPHIRELELHKPRKRRLLRRPARHCRRRHPLAPCHHVPDEPAAARL